MQAVLSGRENPRPKGCKAGSASISPDIKSPFLSLELSRMRQQLASKGNRVSCKMLGLDLRPCDEGMNRGTKDPLTNSKRAPVKPD